MAQNNPMSACGVAILSVTIFVGLDASMTSGLCQQATDRERPAEAAPASTPRGLARLRDLRLRDQDDRLIQCTNAVGAAACAIELRGPAPAAPLLLEAGPTR
jgi:hypothetical protein